MLLTSSDTKQTQMLIFFFTNSAQREMVSMCTQLQITFIALKPCIWRGLNIYFLFTFSLFYIQSEYSNHHLHLTPTRIFLKGADSFGVLYSQLLPLVVCMFTVQLALAAKNSARYLNWTGDYSGRRARVSLPPPHTVTALAQTMKYKRVNFYFFSSQLSTVNLHRF